MVVGSAPFIGAASLVSWPPVDVECFTGPSVSWTRGKVVIGLDSRVYRKFIAVGSATAAAERRFPLPVPIRKMQRAIKQAVESSKRL